MSNSANADFRLRKLLFINVTLSSASCSTTGHLYSFDQDETAHANAKVRLSEQLEKNSNQCFIRIIIYNFIGRKCLTLIHSETTIELADLIKSALPQKEPKKKGHPAKRIFQAIRIEVNDLFYMRNHADYHRIGG